MINMKLTSLPNVSQLSPLVTRILAQNPGVSTLQGTNTYLVGSGTNRILIDTGDHGVSESERYRNLLMEELQRTKARISHVLITHWHPDHTGGVNSIVDQMNPFLSENLQVRKFNCLGTEEDRLPFENSYSSTLKDGEIIKTEDATLRVLYTPGHASDHASFCLEEESSLFSGDCILGETTAIVENLKQYLTSLELYKSLSPPVRRIFPGHGPVIENALEKIDSYISHRLTREDQILKTLSNEGKRKEEILDEVYIGLDEMMKPLALNNIQVHLQKLVLEHRVIHKPESSTYHLASTW